MIGRLRMVGVGAAYLAMLGVVPVTAQQVGVQQELTASILSVYTPPTCVPGVPFADITCTTGFDPWIEQFGLDGITAGCGGGNYCSGVTVTRDQMAVFIEHAMRGTSNWPPHTVLVFHHPASEANSDVNSGTELLSLVAAIPSTGAEAPSATNPWLIKVGPGIFDLGFSSLFLPAFTALEGAGQGISTITSNTYNVVVGSVVMGDHGRLSGLTVNASGAMLYEVAVTTGSTTNVALEQVTLTASTSNPNGFSYGLYASNGSVSLVNCEVTVQGGYTNVGVRAYETIGEVRLDGVLVNVPGSSPGGHGIGFSGLNTLAVITNSRFVVASGTNQCGLNLQTYGGGAGTLDLRNSEVLTYGGLSPAVVVNGASATLLGDLISSGTDGVETSGAGLIVDISNCNITGATNWLTNGSQHTVTVGASKLVGTTNNSGGTVNCFGNYTGSAFLANTCP